MDNLGVIADMDISIIVTCFNEEKNIGDCLETLIHQDYTLGNYEIVVSDGGSKDTTQAIVQYFMKSNPEINLVIETKKGTAAGRNAGIKAAKYDLIAFIDADCEAPKDWLSILATHYTGSISKDQNIIAVGGTNIPPEDANTFMKAIGVSLDSYMGSFNSAQGRMFKEPSYVESLANLNVLYNKKIMIKTGCYDESLVSEAEDADMNYRLKAQGYKFLFIPESYVWHKMRPTPSTWLKNMFRYGKGRARLLKRHPDMWSITYIFPIIFAVCILSVLLIPVSVIFLLPLLYFPLLFGFSIYQTIKKGFPNLFLHVMYVYLIQHFGYAAGEIYGLINPDVK
jgi:succinoglycan biosynthesis protein ExoA